ncbi:MAG: ion channel [Terracoccus sp.]
MRSDEPRVSQWEARTGWLLSAAAMGFLIAYALPILYPHLPAAQQVLCAAVTWATWGMFAVDFGVRVILARHRWRFLRTNLIDLVVVVLPVLRPLRPLRLVTLMSVLIRHAGSSLRGRVLTYVVGSTSLVIFVAALAVLDAERHSATANIKTFADALWWAVTTVTTVGYGDRYPTTTEGRYVAAGLMVAGIALLGVITAAFASSLVDRVREVEQENGAATRRDVAALATEVAALRRELAGAPYGDGPGLDAGAAPGWVDDREQTSVT